jgi:2,4-dienoyl-CoA reductase (NADPH2)
LDKEVCHSWKKNGFFFLVNSSSSLISYSSCTVAIIGAGGIGFDVASFLVHADLKVQPSMDVDEFLKRWHIDKSITQPGGLIGDAVEEKASRSIYLMQRKLDKLGKSLGKTTGWIHRMTLTNAGVHMMSGIDYRRVTRDGHLVYIDKNEVMKDREIKERTLEVDTIVICAGQVSNRPLEETLRKGGMPLTVIGGAKEAKELDAKSGE